MNRFTNYPTIKYPSCQKIKNNVFITMTNEVEVNVLVGLSNELILINYLKHTHK
jgi:hypothetical protein